MIFESPFTAEQVRQALDRGELGGISGTLRGLRPADIAELFLQLPESHRALFLIELSASDVSTMLEYLLPKGPESLDSVSTLPTHALTMVLDRTPLGIAVRVLCAFSEQRRNEVLATLAERSRVNQFID
jgi:Mg/Co/Ni transporter MgtE